ncbi:LAME_0D07558g1_1 [Lachancea meyersii CBS 8951]|uniref:LAME_0D07558g1_1 n=1 Tax=Lachancea meyersii CBS 8951 TaxID=1266667 RepID=A0A1G4JAE7_9SACH|nr:LAME_0D07558g1_1 [Lachancea meyersii CBS 8951]
MLFVVLKKTHNTVRQQRLELCRKVMAEKPGTSLAKWDVIASEMNEFLDKQGLWHSPWFFYDGATLFRRFRMLVYLPLKNGKFDSDAETALLGEAAQTYERSIFDSDKKDEKNDHARSMPYEKKLPVEIHNSKARWILAAYTTRYLLIGPFLILAYGWYFGWYPTTAFGIVCSGIVAASYRDRKDVRSLTSSLKFMKIVHEFEPWENHSRWEEIARIMNAYFSRKPLDFAFDGGECRQIFEQKLSSIIADRGTRMPELIPYARELKEACGWF